MNVAERAVLMARDHVTLSVVVACSVLCNIIGHVVMLFVFLFQTKQIPF
jgi:hypothetical protein